MYLSEFDYNLPEELIAQSPLNDRSSSKLMVVDKVTGEVKHEIFRNIINYLKKGDVLVINDSKVIPARLIGSKEETNAVVEVLLLKDLGSDIWECLVKPQKRVKVGTVIKFGDKLNVECIKVLGDGISHFKFIYEGILMNILDELGSMPLPPYITSKLEDKSRYQTVYARNLGSSAAPTAGLHFTEELLDEIRNSGVEILRVTLHVGLGTFRPVKVDNVLEHSMHSEFYNMEDSVALNSGQF